MRVRTDPACRLTVLAWRLGALSLTDLWWRYVALGGNCKHDALAAYLAGNAEWPDIEHNTVAHALNECLWDAGYSSLAPYRGPGEIVPEPSAHLPLGSPLNRPEHL